MQDSTITQPQASTITPLRFSRALLALVAAATIAISPIADAALALPGTGYAAHSIPVYLLARYSHDVGHNDWAFQGQPATRIAWVTSYVALALLWLAVSIWIAVKARGGRLWLRVLLAAWGTELLAALLTLGAAAYSQSTSTPFGPTVLHAADACSPWWSCIAAVFVVARAERPITADRSTGGGYSITAGRSPSNGLSINADRPTGNAHSIIADRSTVNGVSITVGRPTGNGVSITAGRAIAVYAVLLTFLLLVPLPGPGIIKALLLAVPAAIPALLTPDQPGVADGGSEASTAAATPASSATTPAASAG